MTGEKLIKLERHQMLSEAHATLAQSIKYPQTVAQAAVDAAKARIEALRMLEDFARSGLRMVG
jgi:putative heme iron utilization protein